LGGCHLNPDAARAPALPPPTQPGALAAAQRSALKRRSSWAPGAARPQPPDAAGPSPARALPAGRRCSAPPTRALAAAAAAAVAMSISLPAAAIAGPTSPPAAPSLAAGAPAGAATPSDPPALEIIPLRRRAAAAPGTRRSSAGYDLAATLPPIALEVPRAAAAAAATPAPVPRRASLDAGSAFAAVSMLSAAGREALFELLELEGSAGLPCWESRDGSFTSACSGGAGALGSRRGSFTSCGGGGGLASEVEGFPLTLEPGSSFSRTFALYQHLRLGASSSSGEPATPERRGGRAARHAASAPAPAGGAAAPLPPAAAPPAPTAAPAPAPAPAPAVTAVATAPRAAGGARRAQRSAQRRAAEAAFVALAAHHAAHGGESGRVLPLPTPAHSGALGAAGATDGLILLGDF
jgi:hypothetical protein